MKQPSPNNCKAACGSGPALAGFVQSVKFVEAHGGPAKYEIRRTKCELRMPARFAIRNSPFAISLRPTTRRLAVMNLALRGIETLRLANSSCFNRGVNRAKAWCDRGEKWPCASTFGPKHADTFRRTAISTPVP